MLKSKKIKSGDGLFADNSLTDLALRRIFRAYCRV